MPGLPAVDNGPVDILLQLGSNALGSNYASNADLRWRLFGDEKKPSSFYQDTRFLVGSVLSVVGLAVEGDMGRGMVDIGVGGLHSFVATETVRYKSIQAVKKQQAAAAAAQNGNGGGQPQVTDNSAPQGSPFQNWGSPQTPFAVPGAFGT